MVLSVEIWLLPAIAAGSASYLVSLAWEKFKRSSAPSGYVAGFLVCMSFLMGAICAYYRHRQYEPSLDSNIIIMYVAGATATYLWLLLRRYLPGLGAGRDSRLNSS